MNLVRVAPVSGVAGTAAVPIVPAVGENRGRRPAKPDAPEWRFPAAQCHDGIPLGNGTFGALLWGAGETLRLTINRADYWKHGGGWSWPAEATYPNLRRWLQAGDEATLRRVFEGRESADAPRPDRPTRLPMGRVDLHLPADTAVREGWLDLDRGEAHLVAPIGSGLLRARAIVLRDRPLLALRLEGDGAADARVTPRPVDAPEVVAYLAQHGFPPTRTFGDDDSGGWVQARPGEPALCVGWLRTTVGQAAELFVTAVFGVSESAGVELARDALAAASGRGYAVLSAEVEAWWREWWARAPRVVLADETATFLYRFGLYKLAGLSVPGGHAASLQGPWVEEHRLPPWSADFHFNVNVQECYWPAYAGNHLECLDPLEAMLRRWEPLLRENARTYVGVEDGLLLPHAVDDRGTCMGGFWTGQTDHGSTAWAGQLLWLRYRHSMDTDYLRETVYPFLRGALRTYEPMLEGDHQGLSLPVGVSPEYGGAGGKAWGRNASFQLACIHFLCRALLEASTTLGIDGDDQRRWRDIQSRLPVGTIADDELQLWEGMPLPESHRHHSHLASFYPFGLLDPHGEDSHRRLVERSLRRLTLLGTGQWTGWCVPWAAILHARAGNGDGALHLLHAFRRFFMSAGHYSTHDAVARGFTVRTGNPGIMQVEAALGASAAVLELLAETNAPSGGVLRVFGGAPAHHPAWRDVAFQGLLADGAFLLDARREDGRTVEVRVVSRAGGRLRLADPFGEDGTIERDTAPGEEIVLRAR
jgi:hypothetical protein